jgi:hypothetical protein
MATETLYEAVIRNFPELEGKILSTPEILLQNDSDGTGDYIAKWEYSKPLPQELQKYLKS